MMSEHLNRPADTSMMRIVHDALRRDLERARGVLTRAPVPDDRQLAAIVGQLQWIMAFLEAHHRSEDLGLYPLVRERDPGAAALLDDMASDHEAVAEAVELVTRAAVDHDGGGLREPLVTALDSLSDVLLPHLRREEEEVMPVVSRVLTNSEWQAVEQRYNLDGKSKAQLGREGHWLIDEADDADRARVLSLVPLVPRVLLLYGFGPAYRRRRDAAWRPRHRVQREGSSAVVVDADLDAVWSVVRDPTRVGDWSHECVSCHWMGTANATQPGARFRGRNQHGVFRWGRICEVVAAEPYEFVWRTVPTRLFADSTIWALRLEPAGTGTRIEQTFRVVNGTKLEPLFATLLPAHRDRTQELERDLRRLGGLADHIPAGLRPTARSQ